MPNFFSQLQHYKQGAARPNLPAHYLLDIAANAYYSVFLTYGNRIYVTNGFNPKMGCHSRRVSPALTELILNTLLSWLFYK